MCVPRAGRRDDDLRAAERLAADGELAKAVALLIDAAGPDAPEAAGRLLDRYVVGQLAAGRDDEVLAAVEAVPGEHRSLVARVAEADIRVRRRSVAPGHLGALAAEAAGDDGLSWWLAALRAERLLAQNDVLGAVAAASVLDEVPGDRLLADVALQARGRLRAVAAIGRLLAGSAGPSGPGAVAAATDGLAAALADLDRSGWFAQRALAVSGFTFFRVVALGDAPAEAQSAVTEARDHLAALDSPQLPLAELVVGLVAYLRRDLEAAEPALREAAAGGARHMAYVAALAEHTLLLVALRRSDRPARLLPAVDAALGDLRPAFPAGIAGPLLRTAEAALDAGLVEAAEGYLGRLAAAPAVLPGCMQADQVILRCRAALARGDRTAREPLEGALDALRRAGLGAAADARAAGVAADAARGADAVRAVDARAAVPADPPAEVPAGRAAGGRIEVLAPRLAVTVGGRPRRLSSGTARLLVTLVVRPGPLATDELCGLLWPDVDKDAGRGRLKSVAYRLRRQLGLGVDELVVRGEGTVAFVPGDGWEVDLHEFWRLAAGADGERARAWRLVGGAICGAQFPYEEALAEERHAVLARWLRLGDELRAAGLVDEAEAESRARRLGVAG